MTRHAYPPSALFGDYLRAGAGLVPSVMVLAIAPVGIVETTILGGFAILFAVFGLRTALRGKRCRSKRLGSSPGVDLVERTGPDEARLLFDAARRT